MFAPRAPYASDPEQTRGRLFAEPPSPTRSDFQRDRDRIVHSTAFRRLAFKTQVFVHAEDDHFRTRLTHTIEVSQMARALSRAPGLDDDLAEAVALGHDLGHTPFGHGGEEVLDACLREHGGFDHNSHGLRLVTELERRYADFDGLNLCQETLEGLVKHNGPLLASVPEAILAYDRRQKLDLASHASLEAQAAAIADDIAYNAHDIDDGLRAGLFSLDEIRAAPCVGALLDEIEAWRPKLEPARKFHELTRRVITGFIEDAIRESRRRIADSAVASAAEVRAAGRTLVGFSERVARAEKEIKAFLFTHMYRHETVMRVRRQADEMLRALYGAYRANPREMSEGFRERPGVGRERAAADYIAGMTDRFAVREYRRLFDPNAGLG